jgi:HEAT repeat protein
MKEIHTMSRFSLPSTSRALLVLVVLLVPASSAALQAENAVAENDEAKLIGVLASEASLFDKAKACQRLAVVGGKDAVPALAKLLGDRSLAHYARFGLEPNPDPSADEALREALSKLDGDLRIGVINSIGARRDAAALGDLSSLLGDSESRTSAAAAAALGRIGTPESARTLRTALGKATGQARAAVARACLACSEALLKDGNTEVAVETYHAVRTAQGIPERLQMQALRGVLLARGTADLPMLAETLRARNEAAFNMALVAVREVPGRGVTEVAVASLTELSPGRKAKLIGVLGERGDAAALPAVLEASQAGDVNVRVAAISALESLGDVSAVPVLIAVAARSDKETARLARATLANLPGEEIDQALLKKLTDGGEARSRPALLAAVGERGLYSAVPTLSKAAMAPEDPVRLAAIRSLGLTVTLQELTLLTDALARAKTPEEKDAVIRALKSAARRMPDSDACATTLAGTMSHAAVEDNILLLGVFTELEGKSALDAVSASARDSNAQVRAAAITALGDWQNEKAAYRLLGLLEASEDTGNRMHALEAFSGLVRRLGFPREERLGVCEKAMALSRDDAERKIVIHALAGIPASETLEVLSTYLSQPGIREAASEATCTISERIVRWRQEAVARCMQQVLAVTQNADTRKRADRLLKQAEGKL